VLIIHVRVVCLFITLLAMSCPILKASYQSSMPIFVLPTCTYCTGMASPCINTLHVLTCMFYPIQSTNNFMKKIPPGSEASNVLVGEVDFLSHSIIAFVRLSEGRLLGDITEVPIPTRFLFILLGPTGNQERYHEIGRSIATLMSDEVCVYGLICL